jgi:hypothetical protein
MKMIFVFNGSKKRTLESFNNENNNEINNEKGELGKTQLYTQRQMINNTFKINMLERIQPSTNCSNCGK